MASIAETRLRVRYAETDQMGVVYYANYLVWMEIGRSDFCRMAGFQYSDMESVDGYAIAVADVSCRYHAPARYDDAVLIRTTLSRLRRRTLDFTYEILNAETGKLLAEGSTRHIVISKASTRPASMPARHHAMLAETESRD